LCLSRLEKEIAPISIAELRQHPEPENLRTLQRGNRLSITPLYPADTPLGMQPPAVHATMWRFVSPNFGKLPTVHFLLHPCT
jgi:hypothetical protein